VLVEPYLAGTSSAEVTRALNDRPHRLLSLGVALGEHRRYGERSHHDTDHGLDVRGLRQSITDFLSRGTLASSRPGLQSDFRRMT
jgi:transketolase